MRARDARSTRSSSPISFLSISILAISILAIGCGAGSSTADMAPGDAEKTAQSDGSQPQPRSDLGAADLRLVDGAAPDDAPATVDAGPPQCPAAAAEVMGATCRPGVDTYCVFNGYPYGAHCLCNGYWETDDIFVSCDAGVDGSAH